MDSTNNITSFLNYVALPICLAGEKPTASAPGSESTPLEEKSAKAEKKTSLQKKLEELDVFFSALVDQSLNNLEKRVVFVKSLTDQIQEQKANEPNTTVMTCVVSDGVFARTAEAEAANRTCYLEDAPAPAPAVAPEHEGTAGRSSSSFEYVPPLQCGLNNSNVTAAPRLGRNEAVDHGKETREEGNKFVLENRCLFLSSDPLHCLSSNHPVKIIAESAASSQEQKKAKKAGDPPKTIQEIITEARMRTTKNTQKLEEVDQGLNNLEQRLVFLKSLTDQIQEQKANEPNTTATTDVVARNNFNNSSSSDMCYASDAPQIEECEILERWGLSMLYLGDTRIEFLPDALQTQYLNLEKEFKETGIKHEAEWKRLGNSLPDDRYYLSVNEFQAAEESYSALYSYAQRETYIANLRAKVRHYDGLSPECKKEEDASFNPPITYTRHFLAMEELTPRAERESVLEKATQQFRASKKKNERYEALILEKEAAMVKEAPAPAPAPEVASPVSTLAPAPAPAPALAPEVVPEHEVTAGRSSSSFEYVPSLQCGLNNPNVTAGQELMFSSMDTNFVTAVAVSVIALPVMIKAGISFFGSFFKSTGKAVSGLKKHALQEPLTDMEKLASQIEAFSNRVKAHNARLDALLRA